MTWINTIAYDDASGRLKQLYDRVKGPDDNVDNIMMAHSLRPHTMDGHMALYKYALHHSANTVPKWFLEAIGVLVSHLNRCSYCVEHHFSGMTRLLGDAGRANALRAAIEAERYADAFDAREQAALAYAGKLTRAAASVTEADIAAMRAAGFDDGQILEINQVAAYFAYANRTVLGLGVNTDGDILGLSPNNSDDPNDWSHR
ncbi:carboxymuconolactone decarboxylase family protein [Nitratireductor soli]|uniref:carboxymuconolactone decarboxylase family protein n=1 Tax=Nitratireductor soli TaxID=1670619 RepID=UPI00065E05D7|nr:peroxidase-related enzyme [Nitratireductor soli]